MLIDAEVRLGLGFNAAQARVANLIRSGQLRRASDHAYRDLGSGLAWVGPPGAAQGISKLVLVRFTDIAVHKDFAVGVIQWEAAGPGGALFPALDADITFTRAVDNATMLAVCGVYRPPHGGLGADLDRVVTPGLPTRASGPSHIASGPPSRTRPPLPTRQIPACCQISRPGPSLKNCRPDQRPEALRITRVFSCVACGFKVHPSFMFAGCSWRRLLAIDCDSGASRGHGSVMRRPGSRWGGAVERTSAFQAGRASSRRGSCGCSALVPVAAGSVSARNSKTICTARLPQLSGIRLPQYHEPQLSQRSQPQGNGSCGLRRRYRRKMTEEPLNRMRRAACRCGKPPQECVSDGTELTQQAPRPGKFRNAPRVEREVDVSLLIGRWSVEDATRYVLMGNSPTRPQLNRAAVRHTVVGRLREAGFAVVHTPGRIKGGPHVSIVWPADEPLAHPEVPWPPEVSEVFDLCFNGRGEGDRDES